MENEGTRKWVIARKLGVNLDDPAILDLLAREDVTMEEAAKILEINRANVYDAAVTRKALKVTSIRHGAQHIHRIKTEDLMEYAEGRVERFRWVDWDRAERYRKQDEQR